MLDPHRVAILVLPGAVPMDVAIPIQVFKPRDGVPYERVVCGRHAGDVETDAGIRIGVDHGLEALTTAGTVVVPGFNDQLRDWDQSILTALRDAHARGSRIVSICTGAFALAAAGLLDGRTATTHWHRAAMFEQAYPLVRLNRNVLFVDDGDILTSAGVASGIDLCLHIVRRDFGVHASNRVARAIVAAPYRSGGQAQFVPRTLPEPRGEVFARTREWALQRLTEPITVTDLARHANVSSRTFSRRFIDDTGYTPLQWLLRARVDLARELLEATDLGVDQIAAQTGLGTATNLRDHFKRILGTSPSAYRKTFADRAPFPAQEPEELSLAV
ncbi:helix-turn-helix domain-containing protein [Planctomonas sp. JC2975]|uniref:GlxA family transcriptional regulator n=1 Tax=Planctomonas sp. JC2975 TaxID=2729626 RepID=UPI0014746FA6|nr:helix-turn-helix domain-containing protein [Planctomonas sp. JC2975]NNC12374.1 helix-turn-helix domain-containing protein [Planctomonas sp. JC2975]